MPFFVNKIKFFFVSMDSITDFFTKELVFLEGLIDGCYCVCFISVFVEVAI